MKAFKTILIISIAIFSAGLFVQPAYAAGLSVEFKNGPSQPLFNETNFLPGGESVSWAKVTNTSGATQRIATQALYSGAYPDPNRLGDVLNLVIKQGDRTIYNNALSNFLANGEVYLSDLANGANTQYDFIVSFYSGAQNTFQGKTINPFNILIGFQGTEGGILPGAGSTSGGGGGGGGGIPGTLPPGLTIQNETNINPSVESVTITWTTSYAASSQVIYGREGEKHTLDLTDSAGTPPKYGYQNTTPESDTPANINGKLSHSVTIPGLAPGTKYYYRSVSHGSLAISTEHTFTTLTVEEAIAQAAVTAAGETVSGTAGTGAVEQPQAPEEGNIQGEVGATTETGEKAASAGLAASILGFSGKWLFWIILLLVVAIIAFLINRKKNY